MKLFIVGASGFLGKSLLQELLLNESIEKIYCLIHRNRIQVDDSRVEQIVGDVNTIGDLIIEDRIDACISMAGITNGRGYTIEETYHTNYVGTENVVAFCKKNHINQLYFTSSINATLQKTGVYAESKIKAEKYICNSGLDCMIFRPALIYGYGQELGLGVIEKCIRKIRMVPIFGDGKKLEQPVFVEECSSIMAYYIVNNICDGRIINILGNEKFTYNELCLKIGELIGIKPWLVHLPVFPFEFSVKVAEKIHLRMPISLEQIYHIDSDLAGDMDEIYRETGVKPDSFENNYIKRKPNEVH